MNHDTFTRNYRSGTGPAAAAHGFSIVEFMIAMAIGLVIIAAAAQIYINSSATYRLDEGLSRVQEDARFAMNFLAKDLRMAGFLGCSGQAAVQNNVKNPNDAMTFFSGGLRGYRYTCTASCTGNLAEWTPALPADYFLAGEVRVGTDVIIINRASDLGTRLVGNMGTDNGNIQILNTAEIEAEIQADDILILSDCSNADIFRASNKSAAGTKVTIAHASNVNNTPKLSKAYEDDARLWKLVSRAYYVSTNPTTNEPGLYYKELQSVGALSPGQELTGGVETMRLLYGTDSSGSGVAERYLPPDVVTNWTKVMSARLGFVVRTPESVDSELDSRAYDVLDDTTSALDNFDPVDDRRRRRVFNTTVRIRNH